MNTAMSETHRPSDRRTPGWIFWAVISLTLLASIPFRGDATADVSWLITMCERMLDGERAYVDILETTPPVPVLLYMPGVIFSRLTGITPEAATFAFTYAAAFISLAISASILPEYVTDGGRSTWLVLLPAAVMFFILPRDVFAQREYFAAAFFLPIVSVLIRHSSSGLWPPLWTRTVSAVLFGITIAIKPPIFIFPGILLAGYDWLRTRRLSFLFPSGLLAAGVIGFALTAASLVAFPDYLGDVYAIMRDVYVPAHSDLLSCLYDKSCLGVLSCLALVLILCLGQNPPPTAVLTSIVAIGFFSVYLIQEKYFSYHVFPAAVYAAISAWILVWGRIRLAVGGPFIPLVAATGVYSLVIVGLCFLFMIGFDDGRPVMTDLSWAASLHHPRTLAISPFNNTAFPLARRIGAVWVDRTHSQWVARYTRFALRSKGLTESERLKFSRYHAEDLEWILREIKEEAPEIIIQDTRPGNSWLMSELTALQPGFLNGYKVIAEEGGIRVLRRS
jgi:hypothetical protein